MIIGVGSADCGDDAAGIYIANELLKRKMPENIKIALCDSDASLYKLTLRLFGCDDGSQRDYPGHLIFLDAVEMGRNPGDIALMESNEINSRYPQVSTHKLSLSTIARLIEGNGKSRVWLIGIQPKNLKRGSGLSPEVKESADALVRLLTRHIGIKGIAVCEKESHDYV